MIYQTRRILCFLLLPSLMVGLTSCGIFGDSDDEREKTKILTEAQLYERVQELLDEKNYTLAVENLQLLESRFPFGVYADQAQLEIIYAYYKSGDEDAAIAAAERFLRLHPEHPDADYAWYMKGLANYILKPGLLARFAETDFAARDVQPAKISFREFEQFLIYFPDSPYAADARVRMINIKETLARHEIVVANYYIKRRAYNAAINRAKNALEEFSSTKAVGDALAVLAYCYYQTDLPELAEKQVAVLKLNFPDHQSFDEEGEFKYGEDYDAYEKSLLNRISLGFLDAPRPPVFDSRRS